MYESREKGKSISLATKIWGAVTRVLSSWNKPGLYSFQGSLPRLPLPSVHDTTERVSWQQRLTFGWTLSLIPLFQSYFLVSPLGATPARWWKLQSHGGIGQRLWRNHRIEIATVFSAKELVVNQLRVRLVGGICLFARSRSPYGQQQLLRNRCTIPEQHQCAIGTRCHRCQFIAGISSFSRAPRATTSKCGHWATI